MDCSGFILECPKAALISGYGPNSVYDHCKCCEEHTKTIQAPTIEKSECLSMEDNIGVTFFIGDEKINFVRSKLAALSSPFKAMMYGAFVESKREKIDFSQDGISPEGMRAVEVYTRAKRVDLFCPWIVLELLSFANRFCCEEMKSACDAHLASLVDDIEDALILIDYGLEERATLLVASCLQVLLRELPSSLYNPKVITRFCSSEARERLANVGHASFLLYYFLSQVAMEENRVSKMTVLLLERLLECSTEGWQRMLALHQLGCVMLERKEYKDARCYFETAADAGHIYSLAGLARAKYKQGQQYSAYKLMNSLLSENKPTGWMYQERSLYNLGREKIADLNNATELDPTLTFPYKYRAVAKVEERQIRAAISEIDRIIGFKLSVDCLELRAWLFIAVEDYESALRDSLTLLTLEPNYTMFHGRVSGDHLVELLSHRVQRWSHADYWIQLYDRWSSVDDIGSLAVIQQMLINDPGKSFLQFRQSLLLLRLNCQKAAMRCLRSARNDSSAEHEKLVYEGWILYDTGHREEALCRAENSISVERSFEAFFLKAYILADTSLDTEASSYVIQLLEEALKCPSDGLRKGQALNNLGSIYVECGKLDQAEKCYINALDIKHTRAHQGLARVYFLKNQRKAAYDEMTKLIEKAHNSASAFEKRSEYCEREMAKNDLNMATQLDPLRTYPYRYRAAVLMDDQREAEAVEELTKAIAFKPDLQMLHLRAAFYESLGDLTSALQDSEAALCLDPNHNDTLDLYNRTRDQATHRQK
ncbi:Ethylene-overproduction 1-like protein [Melia azedarach]|nr:Ethylene-overproduction 1-like protein [Melia azedarach]